MRPRGLLSSSSFGPSSAAVDLLSKAVSLGPWLVSLIGKLKPARRYVWNWSPSFTWPQNSRITFRYDISMSLHPTSAHPNRGQSSKEMDAADDADSVAHFLDTFCARIPRLKAKHDRRSLRDRSTLVDVR